MPYTMEVTSVLCYKISGFLQKTMLLETEWQIVGAFENFEKLLLHICPSVCPSIRVE